MSEALVQGRNIAKSYGATPVLTDVSFDIYPGITGLLGSNGAGKTTLLGMILGLHPRSGGSLNVFGRDPWSDGSSVRERIGYSPEHHTMSADMMAAQFVTFVAELHGLPKAEANARASEALWLVGLGEERFRPLGTLSTGQKQRVKLAQALCHDPSLIILDEPTDGLDPSQRESVLELITKISSEFGISVLLSSHLIEEVEQICDSVVIIGQGKTVAAGSISHLKQRVERAIELEVVSESDTPALVEAISAKRSVTRASHDGNRITVEISDDTAFDEVRDVLSTSPAGLMSLQRKSLSLEDVFLENLQ